MIRNRSTVRRPMCALGLALAALAVVPGCFNPFDPRVAPTGGIPQPPPEPNTAIGVLRLYEWTWNKRDPQTYRELFTDDYKFVFALTDTAGNTYRDRALTREEELDIAENIFVRGSASEPPPARISLVFDPSLVALPDSRRGKNARVHKEIAAQTLLRIEQPDFEVTGITRFFVVRGDSALLPQELVDRGFRQDSTRWYIERIQDETLGGTVAERVGALSLRRGPSAREAGSPLAVTFGHILAYFDDANRSR